MKKYIKKNILIFGFLVVASAVYGGLTALIPITAGKIIDSAHASGGEHRLMRFFFISAAELLLVVLFGIAKATLKTHFIKRVRTEIETDLFNAAIKTNTAPTTLINMFCVEVDLIIENYYTNLNEIVGIIVPFVIAIVYSVAISWMTIVVIALCFLVVILLNQVLLSPLHKYMESLSKSNERVNKALLGFLNAVTSLKVYDGIDYAFWHINDILRKRNKLETGKARYGLFVESVNCLFSTLLQIIPLAVIAIMVVNGRLDIGAALAIMLLFEKIVSPIDEISVLREQFAETKSYRERVAAVMGEDLDLKTSKCSNPISTNSESLIIKNLCVKIHDKTIIVDFNAFFEMGKKYLLIGTNGSGKSTFLKILTKQIEEYEGNVVVFGKELKEIDPKALFEMVGIIPQTLEIFEDTIQNNITLGKPVDHSKLSKALKQAGLPEERLNEVVSEGWNNFSGGELHRIALARMFYNPKKIYLLDEVISGLEYGLAKSIESAIISNLDAMVIHISHRSDESLIKRYDGIINMSHENKALRFNVQ